MGSRVRSNRSVGRILLSLLGGGLLAGGGLLVVPPLAAGATTWTVTNCNDSGAGSLRATLAGATSGDTVDFALSPSCPTITLGGTIDLSTDVTIVGPGASNLAVSGGGNPFSIFEVGSGVTATISGLTIEDGDLAQVEDGTGYGGGIDNNGILTLSDSVVSGNSSFDLGGGRGGGIFNAGTLTVTNSTISGNLAYGYSQGQGGGIFSTGTLSVSGSTVSGNTATCATDSGYGACPAAGGGILTAGTSTVDDSVISGNVADDAGPGAGIAVQGGTLDLDSSTVSGNNDGASSDTDGAGGGGVANVNGTLDAESDTVEGNTTDNYGGGIATVGGSSTVSDSTVSSNGTQDEGGGVITFGAVTYGRGELSYLPGSLSLTNSTVSGNSAGGSGGGIENTGTSTLTYATVASNQGPVGGGAAANIEDSSGLLTVGATIVADPVSGTDCAGAGTMSDLGFNIADDPSCSFSAPGSVNNSPTLDSSLGALGNNGGPTATMALTSPSPAIGVIPAGSVSCGSPITTDQRGSARPAWDGGAFCSVGAYEYQGGSLGTPTTVTTTVSSPRIHLGASVTDVATVTGDADGGAPTENVEFYACQTGVTPTLTTGPCSPNGSPEGVTPLTGGEDGTAAATSAPFVPASGGTWCFSAVYAGDTTYGGSTDNTGDADLDPNECVLVTAVPSTTATTVSPSSIDLGGSVTDAATVTGDAADGAPTGDVTFYACQTGATQTLTTGACPATGPPAGTGTLAGEEDDTAGVTSAPFVPTSGGTWCFSAVYSGDTTYEGSADDTSAADLDPNECVLVTSVPSTTATTLSPSSVDLGGSVTDTATVTGTAAGGAPTGDVTFYACQTSTATTLTTGSCPPSDPPIATATLAAGEGDTSGATSAPFIPTSDGTWCFSAVYGGDDSYLGSADDTSAADLDPHECVLVSTAVGNPFRITTSSLPSATIGASYRAPLTVSGGIPPYTWKVEAGALPKGLKLNKGTGIISGKPHRNDNRSSTFTVMVTEGKGKVKKGPQETATKVLTIIVSS